MEIPPTTIMGIGCSLEKKNQNKSNQIKNWTPGEIDTKYLMELTLLSLPLFFRG